MLDPSLMNKIEELVHSGALDHLVTARAHALGWEAPMTDAELERMARTLGEE